MTRGYITLYDFDGREIKKRFYHCKSYRNSIIEGWEKIYANKMNRMYFQLLPIVRCDLVRADGRNSLRPSEYRPQSTIKRPQAIYSNKTSVY